MAKIYAALILKGLKTIADVPDNLKEEVTSVMLAEATGLTAKAASSRLEKGVREGVLEWRWVRVGNCRAKAYRKAAL